jgi:hypothetical protein
MNDAEIEKAREVLAFIQRYPKTLWWAKAPQERRISIENAARLDKTSDRGGGRYTYAREAPAPRGGTYPSAWNVDKTLPKETFIDTAQKYDLAVDNGEIDRPPRNTHTKGPSQTLTTPSRANADPLFTPPHTARRDTTVTKQPNPTLPPELERRTSEGSAQPGSVDSGLDSEDEIASPSESTSPQQEMARAGGSDPGDDDRGDTPSQQQSAGGQVQSSFYAELIKSLQEMRVQAEKDRAEAREAQRKETDAFMKTMSAHMEVVRGLASSVGASASSEGNSHMRWRIQETGLFWPNAAEESKANSEGLFYAGDKQLCYTDVNLWIQRVQDMSTYPERAEELREGMWNLLRGEALNWYQHQLSDEERRNLKVSVNAWTAKIRERFGIKLSEADKWMQENSYTETANLKGESVRTFAMELFKYARVWGDETDKQLLVRLYWKLHPRLRQLCAEPTEGEKMSDYLKKIEEKQIACGETLLQEAKPGKGGTALAAEDDEEDGEANWGSRGRNNRFNRYDQRGPDNWRDQSWWRGKHRGRGDFQQRNNSRSHSHRSHQNKPLASPSEKNSGSRSGKRNPRIPKTYQENRRYRPYRGYGQRQRNKDGTTSYVNARWIWGEDEAADNEAKELEDAGYVLFDWGEEEISEDEEEQANFLSSTYFPLKESTLPGKAEALDQRPAQPLSNRCHSCNEDFGHRKALHEHIRDSSCARGIAKSPRGVRGSASERRTHPPNPTVESDDEDYTTAAEDNTEDKEAHAATASTSDEGNANFLTFEKDQVVEANGNPGVTGKLKRKTSYLRINIKSNPGTQEESVCLDTGCSSVLADKQWIAKWAHNPRWISIEPKYVKGVKSRTKIDQLAEFDFYIPGSIKGVPVNGHFHVVADVIDDLGPKMLLGTNFMVEHGVKINFVDNNCSFQSVFGMKVEGEVVPKHKTEITRRVTAMHGAVVPPHTKGLVRTRMIGLPKPIGKVPEEPQAFHLSAVHPAVLDATIDYRTPLMVLVENNTDESIVIKPGEKLARVEEYVGTESGMFVDLRELDNEARTQVEGSSKAEEFAMWAAKRRHAKYDATCFRIKELEKQAIGHAANTHATERSPTDEYTKENFRTEFHTPSYGVEKPESLPFIKSAAGVSICNTNPEYAQRVKALIDRYEVFRYKGIVPMQEGQKMRIDLVEGWQNQIKPARPYPLGKKDSDHLNMEHDKMHAEGKLVFLDEPTPIACPAFVVWRKSGDTEKGRVVIDLRPLNKIAVPDVYPLADQDDIIEAMQGKKIFTVLDASKFFHQLPVRHEHRNRMVIITERGLERSNVVLMGFKNSPAYAQRFMDRLFFKYRHFVRAYIDDIIIFSNSEEEALEHLEIVLKVLLEARVHINASKSFAAYSAVQLLGYLVSGEGVLKTDDRIAAFKKMKFPDTLETLEVYLGMAGWLRRGIAWFDVKAAPLQKRKTELLAQGREQGSIASGTTKNARKVYTSTVKFEPTGDEKEAFRLLQEHLCTQFMLHHHQKEKHLFFKVDACKKAFGLFVFQLKGDWDGESIPGKDISMQEILPIMFLSRATSNTERGYGSTEAEIAAVVWAVRKLRKMVQSNSHPLVVLTDHAPTRGIVTHKSLKTMDLAKANLKLANAANWLSQFELSIHHIPGTLNVVPDALSRLPTFEQDDPNLEESGESELDDIWANAMHGEETDDVEADEDTIEPVISEEFKKQIVEGYNTDSRYRSLIKGLKSRADGREEKPKRRQPPKGRQSRRNRRPQLPLGPFELREDLLYHVDNGGIRRLCIPRSCVKRLLEAVHDQNHHFGARKMMDALDPVHFHQKTWVVRKYVKFCEACRQNQVDRQPPPGELQPIRPEPVPFHTITMDFVTALPEIPSAGTVWYLPGHDRLDTLCTVTCKFSKKVMLLAGHSTYTAADWAKVLLRALLLADWGIPRRIISDRDPKFVSALWREIFNLLEVALLFSTAHHPQTDGQSERTNQTVEIAIRFHTTTNHEIPWVDILPALQHNLNNSFAVAIGRSPNELVYGFKPLSIVDLLKTKEGKIVSDEAFEVLRQGYQKEAVLLIDMAGALAKLRYDEKHTPTSFEVGETVYLRLGKGYHLPGKPKRKTSPLRAGPFKIIEKKRPQAYVLDFPKHWKVHPVVSVAQLYKPEQGTDPFDRRVPPPEPIAVDGDVEWEISHIVNHRLNRRGRKVTIDYLVRWKGFESKDDWWMARELLLPNAGDLVREYEAKHNIFGNATASPFTNQSNGGPTRTRGDTRATSGPPRATPVPPTPPKRGRGRPPKHTGGELPRLGGDIVRRRGRPKKVAFEKPLEEA